MKLRGAGIRSRDKVLVPYRPILVTGSGDLALQTEEHDSNTHFFIFGHIFYIVSEDILKSGRALWVSPDGRKIAYATFNDTLVEEASATNSPHKG